MEEKTQLNPRVRKFGARLALIGVLFAVASFLAGETRTEQVIRLYNSSGAEVRDLQLSWNGGKAGWVRLGPGQTVEFKARVSGVTSVEICFESHAGVPFSEIRDRALSPDTKGVLELRVLEGGSVHWSLPGALSAP